MQMSQRPTMATQPIRCLLAIITTTTTTMAVVEHCWIVSTVWTWMPSQVGCDGDAVIMKPTASRLHRCGLVDRQVQEISEMKNLPNLNRVKSGAIKTSMTVAGRFSCSRRATFFPTAVSGLNQLLLAFVWFETAAELAKVKASRCWWWWYQATRPLVKIVKHKMHYNT